MVTSTEVSIDTQTTEPVSNTRLHELEKVLTTRSKEDYMTPLNETKFGFDGEKYKLWIPTGIGSHRKTNCSKLFLTRYLTELGGNGLLRYARLMHERKQFDLINENVANQIARHEGSFMIRTHVSDHEVPTSVARALLTPSYKRIDDDFIFPIIDKVLKLYPEFKFLGGRNTGDRTFARYITTEPVLTIGKRKIYVGFQITNSEVGQSGFIIEFFLCDGFCDNGMVFGMEGLELFYMKHSGKRMHTDITGLLPSNPFANQHDRYDMELKIESRIHDMILPTKIEAIKDLVLGSFERSFDKDPEVIIEKFGKYYSCTEEEIDLAKEEFDPNERHAYGLQAAFTSAGQKVGSFERRAELDRIGGMIVEQPQSKWDALILSA